MSKNLKIKLSVINGITVGDLYDLLTIIKAQTSDEGLTLEVSTCTNEHDSKNYPIRVPTITLEQFTTLVENNYSTIHLLTSGNPVIDIRYSIIYCRDGKNQYTPTLNDVVIISNGNVYISYSVHNGSVVYTISENANINDIIQPITTNSNYNSNQIYREEINTVQKLVLSYELVPELVALGYEYSYADIFSWDNGSFKCNTSLYRPVTTGWQAEIVKQQWNKQINTSPYQSANYPTDGQLNTGTWPGMIINEVVVLAGRYRDFFKPWEPGDTGTPIWVKYDGNGNLLQLSFNEISDDTRIVNWYVKDSQGNQQRLSTRENALIYRHYFKCFVKEGRSQVCCTFTIDTNSPTKMNYQQVERWFFASPFTQTSGATPNNTTNPYPATGITSSVQVNTPNGTAYVGNVVVGIYGYVYTSDLLISCDLYVLSNYGGSVLIDKSDNVVVNYATHNLITGEWVTYE